MNAINRTTWHRPWLLVLNIFCVCLDLYYLNLWLIVGKNSFDNARLSDSENPSTEKCSVIWRRVEYFLAFSRFKFTNFIIFDDKNKMPKNARLRNWLLLQRWGLHQNSRVATHIVLRWKIWLRNYCDNASIGGPRLSNLDFNTITITIAMKTY